MQIIQNTFLHTPWWVYAIFIYVVWRGTSSGENSGDIASSFVYLAISDFVLVDAYDIKQYRFNTHHRSRAAH